MPVMMVLEMTGYTGMTLTGWPSIIQLLLNFITPPPPPPPHLILPQQQSSCLFIRQEKQVMYYYTRYSVRSVWPCLSLPALAWTTIRVAWPTKYGCCLLQTESCAMIQDGCLRRLEIACTHYRLADRHGGDTCYYPYIPLLWQESYTRTKRSAGCSSP